MIIYNKPNVVLRKLTQRYLKENKLLNIFSIIGIVLTCILFTCLFSVLINMNNSMQEQLIKAAGSRASGTFDILTLNEMEVLSQNKNIKSSRYSSYRGDVKNEKLNKTFTTSMYYYSPELFKEYKDINTSNIVGNYPEKNNEVMLSTTVLKQLSIEPQVGANIELEFSFLDQTYNKTFILSGYYENEKFQDLQIVFLSENYIEGIHISDRESTYHLYVDMNNNSNLEEKFEKVISESGLEKDAYTTIKYSINPAYSKYMFWNAETIIAAILLILFIIWSGYLIIYNIFNISVLNNIRFYGLLKNIGFTSKQIKVFIIKQGLYLTIIGLPIGLILGYLLGYILLPIIIKITSIDLQIKLNIYIFVFASLFTIITVYLSLISPAKYANKLTSAEAMKVNGSTKGRKHKKNSSFNLYHLAKINILRNKKQFIVLILSLTLMPITLNMVLTFVGSLNYDKFMSKYITTDFVAANYSYFRGDYDSNTTINEAFIDYINQLDLEEAGAIYHNKSYGRIYELNGFKREREDIFTTKYSDIDYDIMMYAYDEFPLSKFEVINGELDSKLLKTGNYIIEIIKVDDYGQPDYNTMRFKVGDKIDINYNNEYIKSYIVLAQVKEIETFAEPVGTTEYIAELALPSEEYLNISTIPLKMSYVFNVPSNKLEEIDSKLEQYIKEVDGSMQFESKLSYEKEYEETKDSILVPGIFISILVGCIGIVNYINVLITSVISRKEEFIILNKIGMTDKQCNKLLIIEGLLYTLFSSITFISLGIIINLSLLKNIINDLWLAKYQFNIISLLVCIPIYLFISLVIPLLANKISISNHYKKVPI